MNTPPTSSRSWLRLARLSLLAGAALALAGRPRPALAHGESPGVLAAGVLLLLTPNVGGEYLAARGSVDGHMGVLLSWPVQFGLDRSFWDSRGPGTVRHRFVVSPELRLGNGSEFGGRVGYRWVPRPLFLGLGVSASDTLGGALVPEVGYRLLDAEDGMNLYLAARADVNVIGSHKVPWAGSLSIGFAFF